MSDQQERGGEPNGGASAYWQTNIRLLGILLAIWFVVSFGFGILFAEPLNRFHLFGFELGFWWHLTNAWLHAVACHGQNATIAVAPVKATTTRQTLRAEKNALKTEG